MKTWHIAAGATAAIVLGAVIYNSVTRKAQLIEESVEGGGNSNTTPTGGFTSNNPKPTEPSISGKKADELLKTLSQASLVGKKVYAAYDDTSVYTYLLNPYTKAKKNQLIGVFSSATPIPNTGGFWVNVLNTNPDPKNKYVKVKDFFLKF